MPNHVTRCGAAPRFSSVYEVLYSEYIPSRRGCLYIHMPGASPDDIIVQGIWIPHPKYGVLTAIHRSTLCRVPNICKYLLSLPGLCWIDAM